MSGADSFADWQAVYDLMVKYAIALDTHDWALLESLFRPDASYQYPGGESADAKGIVARCARALTPLDTSQHLLGTISIDFREGVAYTSVYFQAQHVKTGTPGGDLFVVAGTYQDVVTNDGGEGWLIKHRTQSYSWTQGNPAVVGRSPG